MGDAGDYWREKPKKAPRHEDEDGEGEFWQAYREMKKDQKKARSKANWQIIEELKVPYEQQASAGHIMILIDGERVGFWPSTGRWYNQRLKQGGHGLMNLLKHYDPSPHA